MRVGEESHVEEEVDVTWRPVLEPKRPDRHPHRACHLLLAELSCEPVAQLVDVERRGVDDHVCLLAEVGEEVLSAEIDSEMVEWPSGWGRLFSS